MMCDTQLRPFLLVILKKTAALFLAVIFQRHSLIPYSVIVHAKCICPGQPRIRQKLFEIT